VKGKLLTSVDHLLATEGGELVVLQGEVGARGASATAAATGATAALATAALGGGGGELVEVDLAALLGGRLVLLALLLLAATDDVNVILGVLGLLGLGGNGLPLGVIDINDAHSLGLVVGGLVGKLLGEELLVANHLGFGLSLDNGLSIGGGLGLGLLSLAISLRLSGLGIIVATTLVVESAALTTLL